MSRQNISSGTTWEAIAGYSRAVRIGNWVSVSGTTASDDNSQVVSVGDPYGQTIYALRKIERALKEAGASLEDVIRTRMFCTNMEHWEQICRAHGEIFADIRPVATLVQVVALIDPNHLIEIEADAIIQDHDT